jgi:hypothetical protein
VERTACGPDELSGATTRRGFIDAGGRAVASASVDPLTTYEAGALRQLTTLAAYSDKTTIGAEIPAIGGKGQCSLRRTFSEPQSLIYTAVQFMGDNFIKTNVIYRVLASDVENVEKKTGQRVAILESNYRFSYKGIEDLNGRPL